MSLIEKFSYSNGTLSGNGNWIASIKPSDTDTEVVGQLLTNTGTTNKSCSNIAGLSGINPLGDLDIIFDFWVNKTGTPYSWPAFIFGNPYTTGKFFSLDIPPNDINNNRIDLIFETQLDSSLQNTTDCTFGVWHTCRCRRRFKTYYAYIDGVLAATWTNNAILSDIGIITLEVDNNVNTLAAQRAKVDNLYVGQAGSLSAQTVLTTSKVSETGVWTPSATDDQTDIRTYGQKVTNTSSGALRLRGNWTAPTASTINSVTIGVTIDGQEDASDDDVFCNGRISVNGTASAPQSYTTISLGTNPAAVTATKTFNGPWTADQWNGADNGGTGPTFLFNTSTSSSSYLVDWKDLTISVNYTDPAFIIPEVGIIGSIASVVNNFGRIVGKPRGYARVIERSMSLADVSDSRANVDIFHPKHNVGG